MAGVTNRGKKHLLDSFFRSTNSPASFYVMLCTSATAPTADTNVKADLTEIATGNGYTTSGFFVSRNTTDFDTMTEDDSADRGFIQLKDISWTAAGGNLPGSGNGARYAALIDTTTSGNVIAYWDLTSDRTVSSGQTLTLQDCEIRLNES